MAFRNRKGSLQQSQYRNAKNIACYENMNLYVNNFSTRTGGIFTLIIAFVWPNLVSLKRTRPITKIEISRNLAKGPFCVWMVKLYRQTNQDYLTTKLRQ